MDFFLVSDLDDEVLDVLLSAESVLEVGNGGGGIDDFSSEIYISNKLIASPSSNPSSPILLKMSTIS